MEILSVNKFFWKKGGSEAVFFAEKELLESHGHRVIPFSMQCKQNLDSEYAKYFVNEVDYSHASALEKINSALKIIYSFDAKKKMQWLLSEHNPQLAHFHIFQHQISPSVFGPLRDKNIPIILTLHDLKPMCPNYQMYVNGQVCEKCMNRKFYHCFLNSCTKDSRFKSLINTVEMYLHYLLGYYQNVDKYIAVSQFHRNKMIEFGFSPDIIDLIPNSVEPEVFRYSANDEGYGIFVGRLSKEKGVDTLIKAAAICPDIPIKIIGSGPEENELKKIIEQNMIKNVELLGYKSGNELRNLIANASFSVITSVIYENCPMSILESFSTGKPVIGSNIGGIPELIDENNDGFTFIPGDEISLAEKMCYLWKNKAERIEMGRIGRDKILKKYTPDKHYEQLLATYKTVI